MINAGQYHAMCSNENIKNNMGDMEALKLLTSNFSSSGGPFVLLPLSMLKYYLKPSAYSSINGGRHENPNSDNKVTEEMLLNKMSANKTADEQSQESHKSSQRITQESRIRKGFDLRKENSANQFKRCQRMKKLKKNQRMKDRLDNNVTAKHEEVVEDESSLSSFCKVCGDKASIHVHYGGRSCASCRAFFRRSAAAKARYS